MVDVSCLRGRWNGKNDPLEGRQEDMTTERDVRGENKCTRFFFSQNNCFLSMTRDKAKVRFHACRWQAIFIDLQHFSRLVLFSRVSVTMENFYILAVNVLALEM